MTTDTNTMTPHHPRWAEFYNRLDEDVSRLGCSGDGRQIDPDTREIAPQMHPTHWLSRALLIEMGCDADASLAYFREHGGYCDCEVLMNVAYKDVTPHEREVVQKMQEKDPALSFDEALLALRTLTIKQRGGGLGTNNHEHTGRSTRCRNRRHPYRGSVVPCFTGVAGSCVDHGHCT